MPEHENRDESDEGESEEPANGEVEDGDESDGDEDDDEHEESSGDEEPEVAPKPNWWYREKVKTGTDAGLTHAESSQLIKDVERGVESSLLDQEVPTGEYAGLTRREAYVKKHSEEGVFPEMSIPEEAHFKERFFGKVQRGLDGELLRDSKGALLPYIGQDDTLPIFDTPVLSGKWKGFTRRGAFIGDRGEAEEARNVIEKEILPLVPAVPDYMLVGAREIIRNWLVCVFVDIESEFGKETRYGSREAISSDMGEDGEFWEFEDSLKLLDSDSFDAALTNQLLAGKIGLDEAEKLMRGFAQRFIDVHVERRVERDRKNRLTPAPPKVERKQLLGKGYSTRGEIRDALIKFYNRGGTPAGAWRPGDLFVYGCDKSFAYKIARKMREGKYDK